MHAEGKKGNAYFQRAGCLPGSKKGKCTCVCKVKIYREKFRIREAIPFTQGVCFPLIKSDNLAWVRSSEALNDTGAVCCDGRNTIPHYTPLDRTTGIMLGLRELPAPYLPIQSRLRGRGGKRISCSHFCIQWAGVRAHFLLTPSYWWECSSQALPRSGVGSTYWDG